MEEQKTACGIPAALKERIDALLACKTRVLLAIDGGSASGKTTLAALLAAQYGCTVFHMDDFFLRPEQRTAERLAEAGGNVDRERFLEEVLLPLRAGKTVSYRRFHCADFSLLPPRSVEPTQLSVIEGAYAMHPALAPYYDCSVFLSAVPELQRERILRRESAEKAARFFAQWMPMERRYFEAMNVPARCDLVLEAEMIEKEGMC